VNDPGAAQFVVLVDPLHDRKQVLVAPLTLQNSESVRRYSAQWSASATPQGSSVTSEADAGTVE
jgi:hypothetical protein